MELGLKHGLAGLMAISWSRTEHHVAIMGKDIETNPEPHRAVPPPWQANRYPLSSSQGHNNELVMKLAEINLPKKSKAKLT